MISLKCSISDLNILPKVSTVFLTPPVPPQAGGWAVVGKRGVKASGSLSSFWTPPLRGDVSLEASKSSHTLHMTSTCGRHNASLSAALITVDKVGGVCGRVGLLLKCV